MDGQESRLDHATDILADRQRARETVAPFFRVVDQILRDRLVSHDVGDREPPAGFEDAKHFPEDLALVGSQVDHAIRNDQIHAAIIHRHGVRHALAEFDVGGGIAQVPGHDRRVAPRDLQHRVGHVDADHAAGGADAPRGFKTIDAASGADVQHRLAGLDCRKPGRCAATVGYVQHFFGNERFEIVEVVAGRAAHLLAGGRGPGVAFADLLRDVVNHAGLLVR